MQSEKLDTMRREAIQDLLDRLRKLEAVAEAAQRLLRAMDEHAITWYGEAPWVSDLREALTALEEEE